MQYAEEHGLELAVLGRVEGGGIGVEPAMDAAQPGELGQLAFHRRAQAMLELFRRQIPDHGAQRPDRAAQMAVDLGQRLFQARMGAGQRAHFHGQRQQMLAQVVVQVAADALAFVFLDAVLADECLRQLAARVHQRLLGQLAGAALTPVQGAQPLQLGALPVAAPQQRQRDAAQHDGAGGNEVEGDGGGGKCHSVDSPGNISLKNAENHWPNIS